MVLVAYGPTLFALPICQRMSRRGKLLFIVLPNPGDSGLLAMASTSPVSWKLYEAIGVVTLIATSRLANPESKGLPGPGAVRSHQLINCLLCVFRTNDSFGSRDPVGGYYMLLQETG